MVAKFDYCFGIHVLLIDKENCMLLARAVESESEGILCGVGVAKNVPTPTSV
jgi:hypothetical protein